MNLSTNEVATIGPRNDQAGYGLMRFVGNEEIERQEQERIAAYREQTQPVIIGLASHVRTCWNAARDAANKIHKQMRENLQQRKGEYTTEDLAQIREQGGSEVFINITNVKCRAVESWLYDILLPPGERPFAANPTPIPDLPPDVVEEIQQRVIMQYQQAIAINAEIGEITEAEIREQIAGMEENVLKEIKERAREDSEKIEDLIDDELKEGGWYQALRDVIPDIATYPAGIIEGPVVKMKKQLEWAEYPDGTPYVTAVKKPIRMYRRRSPFDIYPSPGARSLDDGYLIDFVRMERKDLTALIGVEGFNEGAIRLVLQEFGRGGLREWAVNDTERYALENRPEELGINKAGTIDCIKFMGPVQGLMLLQWGMTPEEVQDPLAEYEVTAYLIGNYIIGAKLNDHPLGKRNYYSASFEQANDSPWGKGPPELMNDTQKICNGCARALVNNMGHASGPMVWFFANRLAEGEQVTGIKPWKMWRMIAQNNDNGRPPVGFFQPESIVADLLKVYEYFFKQASEITGIPAYVYGSSDIGGAGKTASGLSMLMNAASKGLKAVASHIDENIIKRSVEEHWLHIMIYEPEKAMGDINIVARASEYLIMMEQLQIRRREFLDSTANPIDMQIIGLDGRAELLRETVRSLKMPVDRIVPDRKDITQNMQESMLQAVFQRIATAFDLPVETIAQLAQGGDLAGAPGSGPGGPGMQPRKPQEALAPSGDRAGGQDFRTMQ